MYVAEILYQFSGLGLRMDDTVINFEGMSDISDGELNEELEEEHAETAEVGYINLEQLEESFKERMGEHAAMQGSEVLRHRRDSVSR